MKPIHIAKKEAKRRKTGQEQQTYEKHKQASRKRLTSVREFGPNFDQHNLPAYEDLREVIFGEVNAYSYNGIPESEYALHIFCPHLTSLKQLPIGLTNEKEEALPVRLLPKSKAELRRFCERQIIRNQNAELVEFVVSGWPGSGKPADKLDRHVADLVLLNSVSPSYFALLVCGQHNRVAELLWHKRPPAPFTRDAIRRLLHIQGLLWCCNDIQLILARNALAERNPMPGLLISKKRKLEPTRVVNDFRERFNLMRALLQIYVTSDELGYGKKFGEVPHLPMARKIQAILKDDSELELSILTQKLDKMIPRLREALQKGGKGFRRELEKPVTVGELSKSFHGLWFSGLSNLQASAVPILRYVQCEQTFLELIAPFVPIAGARMMARASMALPKFDPAGLSSSWRLRATELLYLYRRELLQDPDFKEKGEGTGGRRKDGTTAISAAISFLQARDERLIHDHAGNEDSAARTFYLLDVIPEARLSR